MDVNFYLIFLCIRNKAGGGVFEQFVDLEILKKRDNPYKKILNIC